MLLAYHAIASRPHGSRAWITPYTLDYHWSTCSCNGTAFDWHRAAKRTDGSLGADERVWGAERQALLEERAMREERDAEYRRQIDQMLRDTTLQQVPPLPPHHSPTAPLPPQSASGATGGEPLPLASLGLCLFRPPWPPLASASSASFASLREPLPLASLGLCLFRPPWPLPPPSASAAPLLCHRPPPLPSSFASDVTGGERAR